MCWYLICLAILSNSCVQHLIKIRFTLLMEVCVCTHALRNSELVLRIWHHPNCLHALTFIECDLLH